MTVVRYRLKIRCDSLRKEFWILNIVVIGTQRSLKLRNYLRTQRREHVRGINRALDLPNRGRFGLRLRIWQSLQVKHRLWQEAPDHIQMCKEK